jgi:hypothetical protein
MTKRKMTVVAVLLTAMAGSANAAIIYDTFVQVNIYYGVVQVYSPTSVLLSTTEAMTVETQFPYSQDVAAGQGALLSYFMPLMAQSVGQQLANDPIAGSPPIPAYISTNLAGFENSTGFGAELDDSGTFIPPDPNTSPTPSALELYQMLTSQPFNYMVTGDTGFVELGPQFDYVYAYGPFGPVPGSTADTVIGTTNVDIFERDIQLQETSTPEPGSFGLLSIAIGLILGKQWRVYRKCIGIKPRHVKAAGRS